MRSPRSLLGRSLLLAAVAAVAAACIQMPTDGPVVDAPGRPDSPDGEQPVAVPPRPKAGMTQEEVVDGFFDAMIAFPISTRVARTYFADSAKPWDPSQRTIIYTDKSTPTLDGDEMEVTLEDADLLDASGRWRGPLPAGQRTLRLPMVEQDGQWRLGEAENALMIPGWFLSERFTRLNVYYYDPTGSVVVPEPVFVPEGDQQATALIVSLLRGPGGEAGGVSRTYLPAVDPTGLSVPVDDGVADISLDGDATAISAEDGDRMLAQVAWTLRQVGGVESFRLTIGGTPVTGDRREALTPVSFGDGSAPTADDIYYPLYGVRDGRLVIGNAPDELEPQGRLGEEDSPYRLRSAIGNDTVSQVAAVTRGGGTVLLASTDAGDDVAPVVVATGTDFAEPAWDFSDKVWLLDRTADGALISVFNGSRTRPIDVPGVTGRNVTSMLVSRDGSRLVTTVRGKSGDGLQVSRIRHDDRGRVIGFTSPRRLAYASGGGPIRIRDVGWRTPTSVAVLYRQDEATSQVAVIALDGSPIDSLDAANRSVTGSARHLATSPLSEFRSYVIDGRGGVSALTDPTESFKLDGVVPGSLTYRG